MLHHTAFRFFSNFYHSCMMLLHNLQHHQLMIILCLTCLLIQFKVQAQITNPGGEEEKREDYIEQLIEKDDNTGGDYEAIIDLNQIRHERHINLYPVS